MQWVLVKAAPLPGYSLRSSNIQVNIAIQQQMAYKSPTIRWSVVSLVC